LYAYRRSLDKLKSRKGSNYRNPSKYVELLRSEHRVHLRRSQNLRVAIMTTSSKTKPVTVVDRNGWRWGFTPQAENWNGRFAMLGFVAMLLTEFLSGQGVLHFYNLMQTVVPVVVK
jgi:hypothetical protein